MSTVTVSLLDGEATPVDKLVRAQLVGSVNGTYRAVDGFTSDGILVSPVQRLTSDGTIDLELVDNADVTPSGTYWRISAGGHSWVVDVTGDGTVEELLVDTPASYTAAALAVHAALENPHHTELDDLTDVDATSPTVGRALAWSGTAWVPTDMGTQIELDAEAALARNADNLTSGTVADARIASTIARDSEVTAAISAHEAAADPHTGYQKESEKGQAGGYASLDGSGLVPDGQIPSGIARDSEVSALISAAIDALLDGAPGALDTLNELAAAIGDDASFAATVTTALAGKQPLDADLTALAALTAPATQITDATAHIADTSAAHAASAIAFTPDGSIAATNVQDAIEEVRDDAAAYGQIIPKTIIDAAGDLIVGTAADTAARLAMGSALQVLRVNAGATALEWATAGGGGTPGGSDTHVQYNDGGAFGGDAHFTFNETTNLLTLGASGVAGGILIPDISDDSYIAIGPQGAYGSGYGVEPHLAINTARLVGGGSGGILSLKTDTGAAGVFKTGGIYASTGYVSANGMVGFSIGENFANTAATLGLGVTTSNNPQARLYLQPEAAHISHYAAIDGIRVKAQTSQTGKLFRGVNTSNAEVFGVDLLGGITPGSMADSAAANGTIYYSTTASKLVFKDSGGTVNALY